MKYIKDGPFISVEDKPFMITETDDAMGKTVQKQEASIGRMLRIAFESYEKNHIYHISKGQLISTPSDVTSFNRTKAILKDEPQEAGYYRIEDSDFILLQKVLGWVWPVTSWFLNGPKLETILKQATAKIPEPQEAELPLSGDKPSSTGREETSKDAVNVETEAT